MEFLYPIFKDTENMRNPDYKDKFPTVPFPHKPKTPNNGKEYKRRLEQVCKFKNCDHPALTISKGGPHPGV
jgi:hypothetical protein